MVYWFINWMCCILAALTFWKTSDQNEADPEGRMQDAEDVEISRRLRAQRNKQKRQEKKEMERRRIQEILMEEEREERERALREAEQQQQNRTPAPANDIDDDVERVEGDDWHLVQYRRNNNRNAHCESRPENANNARLIIILSRTGNRRRRRRSQENEMVEENPLSSPLLSRPVSLMSLQLECPAQFLPKSPPVPCIQDEEQFPPLPRKEGTVATVMKLINSVWLRGKKETEGQEKVEKEIESKKENNLRSEAKKWNGMQKPNTTDLEAADDDNARWRIQPIGPPKKRPNTVKDVPDTAVSAPVEPVWNAAAVIQCLTEPLQGILDPFKDALKQGWVNFSSALNPAFSVWGVTENRHRWDHE